MTAKQLFEYALVELNKREAPSLLLEDYNYFINKAINQYINRTYNLYDVNQQKTDDLRVLKSSAILTPTVNNEYPTTSNLYGATYEVDLPDDYLHILNCLVEYKILKTYKCYNKDSYWQQGCKRLTADMYSQVLNNHFLKPTYKNPYYYINNVNSVNIYPTSDSQTDVIDSNYIITVTSANVTTGSTVIITTFDGVTTTITCTLAETASALGGNIQSIIFGISPIDDQIVIDGNNISIITSCVSDISVNGPGLSLSTTPSSTRIIKNRYGNKSKVRMEIRYGRDDKVFKVNQVYIDYLKAPQFIRLTEDEVYEVEDNSQQLEFPDYVCQEIVNELIKLLMENASDPRLQTHVPITQSIATPGTEQPKK